jgi:hypothetical protein
MASHSREAEFSFAQRRDFRDWAGLGMIRWKNATTIRFVPEVVTTDISPNEKTYLAKVGNLQFVN